MTEPAPSISTSPLEAAVTLIPPPTSAESDAPEIAAAQSELSEYLDITQQRRRLFPRLTAGQLPVFTIPSYPVPPLEALPAFVVLGVTAGALGVLFNRGLLICAYAVAEGLGDLPIYEALLQRDLRRGGMHHALGTPIVVELEVEPGAPFAGRRIRELGLPPGCIIVRCRDGGREWVPTAMTRLEPHMRITAMFGPEATTGLRALRLGAAEAEER